MRSGLGRSERDTRLLGCRIGVERSAISESRRPRRFHSAASRDARRWGPCCSRPPRVKRSVSSITGRPAQATTSRGIPPRGSPPARSSPSSRCVSQLHPMKPTRLPAHACAPHSPSFPVHRIHHRRCSYSRSSRHRTRVSASKGRSRRPRSRRRRRNSSLAFGNRFHFWKSGFLTHAGLEPGGSISLSCLTDSTVSKPLDRRLLCRVLFWVWLLDFGPRSKGDLGVLHSRRAPALAASPTVESQTSKMKGGELSLEQVRPRRPVPRPRSTFWNKFAPPSEWTIDWKMTTL